MGGGLTTYEGSRKVLLRRIIPSVRGRSGTATQELGSSSFLPCSNFGRDSKLPGRGNFFVYWILRGLFGDGLRPTRKEV